MLRWIVILGLLNTLLFQIQANAEPLSIQMTGGIFEYVVQTGDSLTKIGARFGISAKWLASENNLKLNSKLTRKQILVINNRHIIPTANTGDLLINLPQRMLFYFKSGELSASFPVGLGKPAWPTPLGEFKVINKVANKTWLVPKSIQEEMRREGKVVLTQVPPGPTNPLGRYWLGLSLNGIGIHGTIAPSSIFQFQSHGCIRLHPDDIEALFNRIERDAKGEIIYAPLLLAQFDESIFLEVHPDIYQRGNTSIHVLEKMAEENNLTELIDWELAKSILELQDGVAREITLSSNMH